MAFFRIDSCSYRFKRRTKKCNHCSWSITFTGSTSGASYHLKRCVRSQILWEALVIDRKRNLALQNGEN